MKVLVPDFLEPIPHSRDHIFYHRYRPEEDVAQEHYDAEMLVIWGNRKPQIARALQKMPQLKLVQVLSAGYDSILPLLKEYRKDIVLCCGVGLHSYRVAEYCLMVCLNLLREMPLMNNYQQQRYWPSLDMRNPRGFETLRGKKFLLCGFGSIAQQLVRYLKPFEVVIRGIARTAGERCGCPVNTWKEISSYLAETDILINLLPGSEETKDIFNKDVFCALPKHTIFINAGRGSTVSETDLITALKEKEIAAAALDVVKNEPLSADSPLWQAPHLLLTPHMGGNIPDGWQNLVAKNAEQLLLQGKEQGKFINLAWRHETMTACAPKEGFSTTSS